MIVTVENGDKYEVCNECGTNIEAGDLYVGKRNYPYWELMTCKFNDSKNGWIEARWDIDGVHYSYDTIECHKVIRKIKG